MIDDQLKEQASLYVAGALTTAEVSEFEQVLRSNLELQLLVKQLRLSIDALVAALPRRTPPLALRARVMRQIELRSAVALVAPSSSEKVVWLNLLPWAVAACLIFACLSLFSRSSLERHRARQLELELVEKTTRLEQAEKLVEEQRTEANQQRNAFTQRILQQAADQLKQQTATEVRYLERVKQLQREKADSPPRSPTGTVISNNDPPRTDAANPVATEIPIPVPVGPPITAAQAIFLGLLRPKEGYTAIGAVSWEAREQKGTLLLEQLAPPVPDKDYQLWLFTDDGRIVSGGVIKAALDGRLVANYLCGQRVDVVTGFKVTLEKGGGVNAPGQGLLVMETN